MATDTQTEMTKTKPEIWQEVHSALTECPYCHKRMSMRTLRWRHVCRRRATPQVLLDAELAEKRRQELLRKVVSSLNTRLHSTTEASED
jgi:5-methylcytosine-specific restriction endonuclease McrA